MSGILFHITSPKLEFQSSLNPQRDLCKTLFSCIYTDTKHTEDTTELIRTENQPRFYLRDDNFDIILFITRQGIVTAYVTGLLNSLVMISLPSNIKQCSSTEKNYLSMTSQDLFAFPKLCTVCTFECVFLKFSVLQV